MSCVYEWEILYKYLLVVDLINMFTPRISGFYNARIINQNAKYEFMYSSRTIFHYFNKCIVTYMFIYSNIDYRFIMKIHIFFRFNVSGGLFHGYFSVHYPVYIIPPRSDARGRQHRDRLLLEAKLSQNGPHYCKCVFTDSLNLLLSDIVGAKEIYQIIKSCNISTNVILYIIFFHD
jgi:hypothetical protein